MKPLDYSEIDVQKIMEALKVDAQYRQSLKDLTVQELIMFNELKKGLGL